MRNAVILFVLILTACSPEQTARDALCDCGVVRDAEVPPADAYIKDAGDQEPGCLTQIDQCGVCGGPGPKQYYADQDGDGRGDPQAGVEMCAPPPGFVETADDPDPHCATDDTDACGVCAGHDADRDCVGVCFGEAAVDGCGICTGGTTGREPAEADIDNNGVPDACDQCSRMGVDRTIIAWTAVPGYSADGAHGPYTFQVILYANGDFEFQYLDMEPFGATATIGHQTDRGAVAVTLDINGEYARERDVVYFHRREDGLIETDQGQPPRWIEIRYQGQELGLADDGRRVIDLGFAFPFGDATYEQVTVTANGVISLAGSVPNHRNQPLPAAGVGAIIAPFWDDLNPSVDGMVQVLNTPGECIPDCAGIFGGVAQIDECGECSGGDRPVDSLDCAGVCNGAATIDVCGLCSGGESGVEPSAAVDCGIGPDLIVDQTYLKRTLQLETVNIEDPCLVDEGCILGLGERRLLRFGTRIANVGTTDLILGPPDAENPIFHWNQCHGHFHFENYAHYELEDPAMGGRPLPVGSKAGFAVIDLGIYNADLAPEGCTGYTGDNQGLSVGCYDTYERNIQCQWIDVTDVPPGIYDLTVTANPLADIPELNHDNNSARARVRLSPDGVELLDDPP